MSGITGEQLTKKLETAAMMSKPISEWRKLLCDECHVYVFGENYLAKRFDQINYVFCDVKTAKEILIDNLYALLRFKYFPDPSEEVDNQIAKIVANFTTNLKSVLKKVSFNKDSSSSYVKYLDDYCLAFRNGVFNFKDNKWLFKYTKVDMQQLNNIIYIYDPTYIITWYFDFDFEPLPINVMNDSVKDFMNLLKQLTKVEKNYCYELMWNMAHDISDKFDGNRFMHLCEIMGYLSLNTFNEHFVILVGAGQNGKNSLFDGCFTSRIVPTPTQNDIESIENDPFITGTLENKAQNIFLETSTEEKIYKESKMLKSLTGSMYQTINCKGIQKYSSVINCKHMFAGNDQDNLKFEDNSTGFRRRVNVFEIWYQWDEGKRYLKRNPDYYDISFSSDLHEIKNDIQNYVTFVYFAMYGIKNATKDFTKNFDFTNNDWKQQYSTLDMDTKEKIESLDLSDFARFFKGKPTEDSKSFIYDCFKARLYNSKTMELYDVHNYEEMVALFQNEETRNSYFTDNDVFISIKGLQQMIGDLTSPTSFTTKIKKIYNIRRFTSLYNNRPYIKIRIMNGKVKVLG